MMKRKQTSHIIIHTAAAKRFKPELVDGEPTPEIIDTKEFLDNFDGDPRKIWEAVDQSASAIRHYHMHLKPPPLFSDIGYHYVIRFDGDIEKGRPEKAVGAHCRTAGMNWKSIGICCTGHGDLKPFTDDQIISLASLVNVLRRSYDIKLSNVIGHCETGAAKTCPGTLVDMDDLRTTIDEQQIIDGSWADIKDFYTVEQQMNYVQSKIN